MKSVTARKLGKLREITRGSAIPIMLFTGAALLFGIVATSFYFARQTQSDARMALEAHKVNDRLVRLFSLVQDAETSQRGFLLTGSEPYLGPFRAAMQRLPVLEKALEADLILLGISREKVVGLETIITEKLDEMQRSVDLKVAGRDSEALDLIRSDVGKVLMDEFRQIMLEVEFLSDRRSLAHVENLARASAILLGSIALGAFLIVCLSVGVSIVITNRSRGLHEAQEALARQNENLEERVRQRTAHLERANREIQAFAYIVSHDLRAPLVNIMGFTAELERVAAIVADHLVQLRNSMPDTAALKTVSLAVDEDMPEALHFIRISMNRMDDLINAILKLARIGTRQLMPEPISINELLRTIVETHQHQLDETGGVVAIAPDMPEVVSDRLALMQVLGNFIDNALKYTHPSRPAVVEVRGYRSGGLVVLEVSDNGRGIATHDTERVFELFRRSGVQDRAGDGIGLAYVRALARRLGGDVSLVSTLGEGSVFRMSMAADIRQGGEGEMS